MGTHIAEKAWVKAIGGMDAKPAPAEDLYARVQARAAELRAEGFDPGEAGTMAAMEVLGGRKQ
jgi:hypothetical protein